MTHEDWREALRVARRYPCTVLNVKQKECRWVTDEVTPRGFHIFCGEPVLRTDRPYCKDHYPLVYIKRETSR